MPDPASSRRASDAPQLPAHTGRFIAYCLHAFRGWIVLMLLLETGQAASNILVPYAIKAIMDGVAHAPPETSLFDQLRQPLLWLVALNVAEIVFSRASGAVLILVGPRLRQRTAQALYAYLQHHSVRYFSQHFAGALAHRISETAISVNHTAWSILFDFWPISVTFAVSLAMLFSVHTTLGYFVAAWVLAYTAISYWLATRCQPYAQAFAAVRSQVNGKIVDAVSNMQTIKLFARQADERAYLHRYLEEEVKSGRRTFWYMERVRWFQFIAVALLKLGTVYYALRLWEAGQIGVGDFTLCVSVALLVINDARNLTRRFLEFFEYVGNVANGVATIIQPHDLIDAPDARPLQVTHGRIEYRHVTFGYDFERPVFEDLSVVIEPGQRVGLVGYSGSGKSTFAALLLRYYDPQSGQILIDGQDIATVSQQSLHRQIGLIPQEPQLFHRSLRDNIAYGRPEASDAELYDAARIAHVAEFIDDMPQGYDALVGERGVKLSGGQRQRIALARVILKDAPILVFDEATASLDSVTEKTIQDNLDRATGQKTVMVIAHRLATLAHLDRILVFDHGRIVEDGDHATLLARRGLYYRLWSMQADGFLPES